MTNQQLQFLLQQMNSTGGGGGTGISVEPDQLPSPTPPMFRPGMPPGQGLNPNPVYSPPPVPTGTPYPYNIPGNPFATPTPGPGLSFNDLENTSTSPYSGIYGELFPQSVQTASAPDNYNQITPGAVNQSPYDPSAMSSGQDMTLNGVPFGMNQQEFTGIQPLPPDMYDQIYGQPSTADPAAYIYGNPSEMTLTNNPAFDAGFTGGSDFGINPDQFTGMTPLPPDIYDQVYGDNSYKYDPGSVNVNTTTGGFLGQQDPIMYPYEIQPDGSSASSAPGITYPDEGNQPVNAPAGPVTTPYPFFINQFPGTSANGVLGTGGGGFGQAPSTPDIVTRGSPGMLDANGNIIPGTATSQSDEARMRNMGLLPEPGFKPSDLLHPGRMAGNLMKDAAGNIIDGTGKIVAAAGQAAVDFYHNIMNDPRNTGPDYLRGIGYQPGQGDASLFPSQVTGPTRGPDDTLLGGVAGQGGSFFHGNTTTPFPVIDPTTGQPVTDVGASAMNPRGYNYPTHGAPAVAGAFAGLGAMGTTANINALGNDAFARGNLLEMAKKYYAALRAGRTSFSGSMTGSLVGGPPGNVFTPSFLKQYPMFQAQGGPIPVSAIKNPAAFGGGLPPGTTGGRASIHFNPRSPV